MTTTSQYMRSDQDLALIQTQLLDAFKTCQSPEKFIHDTLEGLEIGLTYASTAQSLYFAIKHTFDVSDQMHKNTEDDTAKLFFLHLQDVCQGKFIGMI